MTGARFSDTFTVIAIGGQIVMPNPGPVKVIDTALAVVKVTPLLAAVVLT